MKAPGQRHNFLETLRAPIYRPKIAANDIYAKTQVNWRGKLPATYGTYQRRLDRKLSEHRKYDDPYQKMRTTFQSSIRGNQ